MWRRCASQKGRPQRCLREGTTNVKKLIVNALKEYDLTIPQELQSPAYDILDSYQITEIQIDQILKYWVEGVGTPTAWSYAPR